MFILGSLESAYSWLSIELFIVRCYGWGDWKSAFRPKMWGRMGSPVNHFFFSEY